METSMKIPIKAQIQVVVATLVTIIANILADALPLNGQTTAGISNLFDVYFVPAGFTFSIWGIIYLGLIAYTWYQTRRDQSGNSRLAAISGLFVGSCLANIAWLFFWHYNLYALSLVAMLALLVLLIIIYLRLYKSQAGTSRLERWCVDIPFKIYLGWISVATIANVTDVLYYYQWDGGGTDPLIWAQIMLVVGTLLSVIIYLSRRDLVIPLVFVWAYAGIGVKFKEITQMGGSAWAMAILIIFMIISLDLGKKIKAGSEVPLPGSSDKDRS
jgi:benzodiazapine receptor